MLKSQSTRPSFQVSFLKDSTAELSGYQSQSKHAFWLSVSPLHDVSSKRPTVEARTALYITAQRQAEDTRVQIRKVQQASVKRGKFAKHSVEPDEVILIIFFFPWGHHD